MIVYHGSDHIIKSPRYLGGKPDNDYGNGFYTTAFENRARSWAALNRKPDTSIVNVYELDDQALTTLDLNDYGVLAWIAEVVANRGTNQEAANVVGKRLVERYRLDSSAFDLIKGYRADDSYTQVIEAFLMNQLNIHEVERLFYKGSLGNQLFLKSENAYKRISWVDSYAVTLRKDDLTADLYARREVNQFLSARIQAILLEGYEVPGITARYALQHPLIYRKEFGGYENAGV